MLEAAVGKVAEVARRVLELPLPGIEPVCFSGNSGLFFTSGELC